MRNQYEDMPLESEESDAELLASRAARNASRAGKKEFTIYLLLVACGVFLGWGLRGVAKGAGPRVDCSGDWGSWGTCSKSCGVGARSRTFKVTKQAANNGTACAATDGEESLAFCNTQPCPGQENFKATPPLCNASVSLPKGNWTTPRKFDLPEWMDYCYDFKMAPWDEFKWPGRNYCWARTKAKACYNFRGGLPEYWLAQKWAHIADKRVPDPDTFAFPGLANPELCDRTAHGAPLQGVTEEEKRKAMSWIIEHLGIYVLNLKWSTERWEAMQKRMSTLGLRAERIDGIDLRPPGALDKAREDGFVPPESEFNIQKAWRVGWELMNKGTKHNFAQHTLEDWVAVGTVGCAAAHINAQAEAGKRATKAGKSLALVMEDDIWLEDDFVVKLYRLLTGEAPCDWDIIALSSRCPYGTCVSQHLSRVQVDGNEPPENCHGEVQYGMFAMLYRTVQIPMINKKLKDRIWNDETPGCVPPDVAMSSISDQIAYYSVPGNQLPGFAVEAKSVSNRLSMNR